MNDTDAGFFLSASNPTATVDQRDLEALALEILATLTVARAREEAGRRWKTIVGAGMSKEARARFDEMIEEHVFCNVLRAVNSDPNHPKVLGHFYGPPHEWFGKQVPGSRSTGGDCPDNHYSLIPVDDISRFVITGRRGTPPTADVPITLLNLAWLTLGSLGWQDVKVEADGSFRITVDPEPANGRPNHIQTRLGASHLLIRDCRADWREVPNSYRIERLDPPSAPPRTGAQLADLAAQYIVSDIAAEYWFLRPFAALDPNTVPRLFNTGAVGGLVSQMSTWARLSVGDDEAFVFTLHSAGARFFDAVLYDQWFRTFDYWRRTSSMNNAQGIPNADGSTTYVVAPRDPGVHNWLDSAGFHDVFLLARLQVLPSGAQPRAEGRLVALGELDKVLPKNMRRIDAAQRTRQIEDRRAAFSLRHVDR